MIGVYYSPESMTRAQYEEVGAKLQAANVPLKGNKMHCCFGQEGELSVFEVWETQEEYDAHAVLLLPIIEAAGVKMARPADIVPVVQLETT